VAFLAKQVQDFEKIVLQNLASSSARVGVGAKHSDNNLWVKPEIFYPNASPVLFAANPTYQARLLGLF
jgi:hypothetical protein